MKRYDDLDKKNDQMDDDSIDINSDEVKAMMDSWFPNDDDGREYSDFNDNLYDD